MSARRKVSSEVSVALLDYVLREKGISQEAVAEALEVTPGFISRVRGGERSFTVEHLEQVAELFGAPLGALLLAAVPLPKPTPKTQRLHDLAREAILAADEATAAIRRKTRAAVAR